MSVIYALFVCTMVNAQPTNCGQAVTQTFETLAQCEQMKAMLRGQEGGAVRLICMSRPISAWAPAD